MGIKTIYTCDVCDVVIPEMPSQTGINLIAEIKTGSRKTILCYMCYDELLEFLSELSEKKKLSDSGKLSAVIMPDEVANSGMDEFWRD